MELDRDVFGVVAALLSPRDQLALRGVNRMLRGVVGDARRPRLALCLAHRRPPRRCVVPLCDEPPLVRLRLRYRVRGGVHRVVAYPFCPYCRQHFHAYVDNLLYGDALITGAEDVCVLCLR